MRMEGTHGRLLVVTGVLLVAVGAVRCDETPLVPDDGRRAVVVVDRAGGLTQTLEVRGVSGTAGETIFVGTGDSLQLESVVTNEGSGERDVEHRICGLHARGLDLDRHGVVCAGYSRSRSLAPGESIRAYDRRVVESGPGTYELEVQHLLAPERWLAVEVRVRD